MLRRHCSWGIFVFLVGALLLSAFALPSVAQDDRAATCETAIDYLVQGKDSAAAGNFEDAIAAYSCAITADPNASEPVQRRMEAALLAGHYILALDDYTLLRSRFYPQDSGIFGQMLVGYRDAIEASPDDVSLYMFRSFLNWSEHGKEAAMLRDCDRIQERDPDNRYAYLFCGTQKFFTGDREAAEADLARVVELDPDNPDVYGVIGITYVEIGQFEHGLEYINQAFDLGADAPVLYVLRADAYTGLGDKETAARDYLRHIEAVASETVEGDGLTPDTPVTLEMTAERVFRLPLTAQAGQILRISTRARPEVVDTLIVLLDEAGTPLAGNDDSPSLNAVLNRVEVPADGRHTLLVTSFNGVGEGEVVVRLSVSE